MSVAPTAAGSTAVDPTTARSRASGASPGPAPAAERPVGEPLVTVVAALSGLAMLVAGVWALVWPRDFADFVRFDYSEHFLHDAGAFQIGIGLGLLLALLWRDALAAALTAFLVANTIHAYNHAIDLDIGGRDADPWLLGALSVLLTLALRQRLRQLRYVVGHVRAATTQALTPFVEQKTVVVTTHRRDGAPVPTAVSLAVDGDRAVFRSYEKAGKTRRLRNDPTLEVAPSTSRGVPTGPAITARARRLDGTESGRAARLLRRKHPLLHGVLVPLSHRAGRAKTGRTVHFELTPVPSEAG
ncbi:MAG TPA: PPOX class F420-dependent oxidoreductase [Acidimicrobiales bacterium]|nr:PPOX class F420-dependent oxidoreductase [Acidimicrobiales bacterium]